MFCYYSRYYFTSNYPTTLINKTFSSAKRDEHENQELWERHKAAMLFKTTITHFFPGDTASNFSSSSAIMCISFAPSLYKSCPSLTCQTTQALFIILRFLMIIFDTLPQLAFGHCKVHMVFRQSFPLFSSFVFASASLSVATNNLL